MNFRYVAISDIKKGDAEELKLILRKAFGDDEMFTEKRAMTDAERAKKYREAKRLRDVLVTECDECDERDETKESTKENIYINNPTNNSNANGLEDNTTNTSITQEDLICYGEIEKEEKEINKENEEKEIVTKKRNRKRDQPEFKRKYGQFHNVLLSNEEFEKIQRKFPDTWQDQIEELSIGIESRGYKYKSHYAALLSWAKNAGIQEGRHPIARVTNVPRQRESWVEVAERLAREEQKENEVIDL